MGERHVDGGAGRRHLGNRRDERLASAAGGTHRLAQFGVEDTGGVLDLAMDADYGRLAVGDGCTAEHVDGIGGKGLAECKADVGEIGKVSRETPGRRVVEDRDGGDACHRLRGGVTGLRMDRLRDEERLAAVHGPPSPDASSARRTATRRRALAAPSEAASS